mmetsp:Transcript_32065/g.102137  ORF Transcript_32065/g.102137 Transcript_32065/m.102137 type:complete len:135 (+) Transcript_32065:1096-1500(+)
MAGEMFHEAWELAHTHGRWEAALEALVTIKETGWLRSTGPGSSPQMWNLLDNVKYNLEQQALGRWLEKLSKVAFSLFFVRLAFFHCLFGKAKRTVNTGPPLSKINKMAKIQLTLCDPRKTSVFPKTRSHFLVYE